MRHELIITGDGSHTVRIPEQKLTYHSTHGAINESQHVYINAGLKYKIQKQLNILEVGFGTGLNALLTLIEAEKNDLQILYDVVELYPLDSVLVASLNYLSILDAPQYEAAFKIMHESSWNFQQPITKNFTLRKITGDIKQIALPNKYDVVYFDPFDPVAQPELWTEKVFKKVYNVMNEQGVFVTYSSRTDVRKALVAAGFSVSKLAGPRGKREIVRASKA